jgi:hypothetical protein
MLAALGCSSAVIARGDLFQSGFYHLDADTVNGCTLEASASREGQTLKVEGEMTVHDHRDAPLSGEVVGQLLAPDGTVIDKKSALFVAHPHSRHNHPAATFELIFEHAPPPGTTVYLSHTFQPFTGVGEPIR